MNILRESLNKMKTNFQNNNNYQIKNSEKT